MELGLSRIQREFFMNLPNKLTVARLIMVPIFVILMSIDHLATYIIAYIIFTAASITDYFDGKIARERNLVTNFGKLMDPLADKVLMAAAFVMVMEVPLLNVPGWSIVAILAREFLVTGARSLGSAEGTVIAANKWGKLKTVLQMVYVFVFLFFTIISKACYTWLPEHAEQIANIISIASLYGIIAVSLFTVYTGIQFAQTNWVILNLSSQE
jgi:CDP-diacylglycerol---glycerol-3-phosphate 3-phosphatidyltransferase